MILCPIDAAVRPLAFFKVLVKSKCQEQWRSADIHIIKGNKDGKISCSVKRMRKEGTYGTRCCCDNSYYLLVFQDRQAYIVAKKRRFRNPQCVETIALRTGELQFHKQGVINVVVQLNGSSKLSLQFSYTVQ